MVGTHPSRVVWGPKVREGLTCQAGPGTSVINEEVVLALGEQGQGSELEHPRHQEAGLQQRSSLQLPGSSLRALAPAFLSP